jgi:hypothetical protein
MPAALSFLSALLLISGKVVTDSWRANAARRLLSYVTLAVGPTEDGPWTAIPAKLPRGKKLHVVVPPWLRLGPLQVDLSPFFPKLRTMRWGKIELPSGDAITVELKEIDEAWNISTT